MKITRKLHRSKKKSSLRIQEINELFQIAEKHEASKDLNEAQITYNKILKKNPRNHHALWKYAMLLLQPRFKNYKKAEQLLKKAVSLSPNNLEYINTLAFAYNHNFKLDQAIKKCRKVLDVEPNNSSAYYNIGFALALKKDFKNSKPFLEKAIELNPLSFLSYAELCDVYYRLDDAKSLKQILNQCEDQLLPYIHDEIKQDIQYLLGKYYDILGNYEKAFSYFSIANTARLECSNNTIDNDLEYMDKILSVCNESFLKDKEGSGFTDPSPIFILGMPRSGTSLVEQILISHPEVSGGGERKYFDDLKSKYNFTLPLHFNQLGREYIQAITRHRHDTHYVTDKMPYNFLYVCLIKLALPNAKIIHCKRNPLDTCLSCYMQGFSADQAFTCDLVHLGKYYINYQKMMNQWHTLMPGFILDVEYEKLVSDQKTETMRILDYCELKWDDSCTHFYETKKFMATASRSQVNQKIYNSSIGRWKHYEKHLAPLIEQLKQGGVI